MRAGVRMPQTYHKTKSEARTAETEWKQGQKAEGPAKSKTNITLVSWGNTYIDSCLPRYVKKTTEEKQYFFKQFFKHINSELPVSALTRQRVSMALLAHHADIIALNKAIAEKKIKVIPRSPNNSVNKMRKNLHAAWEWAVNDEELFDLPNPFRGTSKTKLPHESKARYIPPEKDFKKVFNKAKGADKLMLEVFIMTAARKDEVFRLQCSDISFVRNEITLHSRKNRSSQWEARSIPIADSGFRDRLKRHVGRRSGPVFNDQAGGTWKVRRKFLKGLCKRAGVPAFDFHAIRHLTGSILVNKGVALIVVQQVLGHKNLRTTEKYLHIQQSVAPALRLIKTGSKIGSKIGSKKGSEKAQKGLKIV